MQDAASGSGKSLAELMAARKEQRKGLGAHREQIQAHVQRLRCLQSSRPSTATPKTTRAVLPTAARTTGGGAPPVAPTAARTTTRASP